MRCVALLRGVNLGGRNMLAMAHLAKLFSDAGCRDVRTYIQSGNVIFDAGAEVARGLEGRISKTIATEFGLQVPILLRTAAEMKSVTGANPFLRDNGDEKLLHVLFLEDAPAAEAIAQLDPARSTPDEFAVRGREIYLRLPKGAGLTKLTNAWFDSKLRTVSTGRNWRTTLKLAEMLNP